MSKYVKDLVTNDLRKRFDGVQDAVLVNLMGLSANKAVQLRQSLREKNIELLLVKNSLARRATEGTPLHNAFTDMGGSLAVAWGSEDFVSLVKEVVALDKNDDTYPQFEARGGVMDGEQLTADRVREISKWPNRQEQLSILSGQICGVAAELSSQLLAMGGALASQIEEVAKKREEEGGSEG